MKPSRYEKIGLTSISKRSPYKFSKTLTQDSFLQDSNYPKHCETEVYENDCKDSIFEPKITCYEDRSISTDFIKIEVKKAPPTTKSKNSIESFNYFKSFGNHFSQKKQSVMEESKPVEMDSKQSESIGGKFPTRSTIKKTSAKQQ